MLARGGGWQREDTRKGQKERETRGKQMSCGVLETTGTYACFVHLLFEYYGRVIV